MRTQEKQEAEKLTELLAKAEGHPMMKAILAEKAAEVLEKRQKATEVIEALKKERAERLPKLETDLAEKEAKYLKLKFTLQTAIDEIQSARAVLWSEGNSFDADIRNQESFLYETSDPLIEEAILWFRDRHEALLHKSPDKQTRRGKINVFSMTKELTTFSNIAAIKDALAYCLGAISRLQSMKLTPAPDLELITELKRGIPDTGVMEEITADKPLPRINVDPRSLLPSDSEMDWKIWKLTEKFKKLIRK